MSVSPRERIIGQSHFLHSIWQLTSAQIRYALVKDVFGGGKRTRAINRSDFKEEGGILRRVLWRVNLMIPGHGAGGKVDPENRKGPEDRS